MALATAVVSQSTWLALTMFAVAIAGAAWVQALALFNTSVQLSTPRWVVGRALSFYQMCTFGGMAFGSWLWGTLVETHSIEQALQLAAASTLIGVVVGFRWAVPPKHGAGSGAPRSLAGAAGRHGHPAAQRPGFGRGGIPDQRIRRAPAFTELMYERRRIRRRDGARQWTLLHNLEQHVSSG